MLIVVGLWKQTPMQVIWEVHLALCPACNKQRPTVLGHTKISRRIIESQVGLEGI